MQEEIDVHVEGNDTLRISMRQKDSKETTSGPDEERWSGVKWCVGGEGGGESWWIISFALRFMYRSICR